MTEEQQKEFNRKLLLIQAKRLDRNKIILDYFRTESEIEQMNFELITDLMNGDRE